MLFRSSALALFDTLPADRLVQALVNRDAAAIARAPGLGKKTAEKIILELADNADLIAASSTSEGGYAPQSELIEALTSLGYSQQQASGVVGKLNPEATFEEQLKEALRELGVRN